MKIHRHILIFVIVMITLSSCQNQPKKKHTNNKNWNEISSWSFKGKIAINDGIESGSGRLSWKSYKQQLKVKFTAPLGQGSWEITEQKGQSQLISSKTGVVIAKNTNELIENEIGWNFPWDNLKYWLRAHHTGSKITTHSIPINKLTEMGWQITFQKWVKTPLGLLPKKIKATKPPYSIKLIIYQWEFDQ